MKERRFIAFLGALVVSACSSTGVMRTGNPEGVISGAVTRNLFQPDQVEVILNGKAYRGPWRVESPTPEQRAAVGFQHKRHLGLVNSTLVAEDGSKMQCRWETHSYDAEGGCNVDGREYKLNMLAPM